jgi:hypothetical protein
MDLARRQEDNEMMVHGRCCIDHDCTHDPEKSIGYESEEKANEPKKIPKRPTVEKVRRRPSLSTEPLPGGRLLATSHRKSKYCFSAGGLRHVSDHRLAGPDAITITKPNRK